MQPPPSTSPAGQSPEPSTTPSKPAPSFPPVPRITSWPTSFSSRPARPGPAGNQKLFIQGNYDGRLNNTFGQLALKNGTGATIASTTYGTPPIPGDFDSSGTVDNQDYNIWTSTFGSTVDLRADGNLNGIVDAADFTIWRDHLGQSNPGAGSGGAALASPQPQSASAAASLATDAFAFAISPSALTAEELPSAFASQKSDASLTDAVFQTWSKTRDIQLLAALADGHASFRHSSHDKSARRNADEAASTDCALADLLTLQSRPL